MPSVNVVSAPRHIIAFLLFGFCCVLANSASATEGQEFYKGKTVRIVVGYAPGGGFDAYARMLAPHLAAKLGTRVIVENKPGASGFNALMSLLREPGDGLSVLLLDAEAAAMEETVEASAARFDMLNLAYLGRVSYENRTLVALKSSAFATIDGFVKTRQTVHFGSGSRVDTMGSPASIFCYAMGAPCKLITGYQGAADVALAMQRGEVDALITSESQAANFVGSGTVAAVAILGRQKAALLPDVPSIFDMVKLTPQKAKWLQFRADMAAAGRTLILPGDTPADRVTVLAKAVDAMMTDPGVQAEGEQTNRPLSYASGSETRKIVERIFSTLDNKDKAFIKQLLASTY